MTDARRGRDHAKLALRVLLTVALIAALVWRVPLHDVAVALKTIPASGVALACLVLPVQILLGAWRWKRMLARVGETQPLGLLVRDTLVGAAYNLVLPSTVGGDVIRAMRCGRRLRAPHAAYSTTLFERMVGLPTLAVVAAPGIAVVPGGEALVWPTVGFAVVAVIALVVAKAPLAWLAKLASARAPKIMGLAQGMSDDLAGPLSTMGTRAEAFGWTLLYQAAGISILAAFVAPSGDVKLMTAIYAGLPLIVVATMLPVTIAGIGLRESLFVVVLGRLGVPEATALALSVLWLATYFALALPGVFVVLLEPREPPVDTTSSSPSGDPSPPPAGPA